MNDDEIINLFLKRDENGIIELSTKYHPYCYKIAWNLLANREDAEECLNDTWFSVWSQIPPTHPPVLAHFCGRITRNLSIDRIRKKFAGKRPDVHMADVMDEMEQLNVTYTVEEQLAEKVDISTTHMSHIETGSTKLSLQVFGELAEALHKPR